MNYALTPQQLAVLCALSSGVTTLTAAEQAGVHRNTINNWRRNSLPFQRALADAQYDRALHFRESIEDLVDLAVKSLHELLTDPKTPPSVRLKAALAIISTASTPPEPKKQIELIMETANEIADAPTPSIPVHKDVQPAAPMHNAAQPPATPVHNPAQPEPSTPAQTVHNEAQSEPIPPTVHNPAQPTPPEIRASSRPFAAPSRRVVARNAQCPCGSGKKYKRCCGESLAAAA